jgi:uncharacterized RDD family membrane protein YckC
MPPEPTGWAATAASAPPPGPVPGLVYASTLRRVGAYIIDAILLGIVAFIVALIVVIPMVMAEPNLDPNDPTLNLGVQLAFSVLGALYFILTWRLMRGTPGQRMLGMFVGNASDGASISWGKAFVRWLALTLGPIPAIVILVAPLELATLVGLVSFLWSIVLLVTTATSPTHQGLHDRWAETLVVRRA